MEASGHVLKALPSFRETSTGEYKQRFRCIHPSKIMDFACYMFQLVLLTNISVDKLTECVSEAPASFLDVSWSVVEASGDALEAPPSVLETSTG